MIFLVGTFLDVLKFENLINYFKLTFSTVFLFSDFTKDNSLGMLIYSSVSSTSDYCSDCKFFRLFNFYDINDDL